MAAGVGTSASLGTVYSSALDLAGQRYFYSISAFRILLYDIPSQAVTFFAGTGGAGSVDGIGTAALIHQSYGMAFGSGALYFSEFSQYKIRRIGMSDANVTTIAGGGGIGSVNGVGTLAKFASLRGVALDAPGTSLLIVRAAMP